MSNNKIKAVLLACMLFFFSCLVTAQDKGKLYFTTSFGLISTQGKFSKAVKSTLAFNSGVEMAMKKNWYSQLVFDFNALKYDQQVGDANSPYLFQNTNSSLLLLGINSGRNKYFKNKSWFASLYGGGGYLNIGEPRITVNNNTSIARQEVARKSSVFARVGTRLAYKTKSNFFQTLYFDASYWTAAAKIQGGIINGFSFYIGTRFGTVQ